jgi:AcrR family transcriptional regulator
MPKPAPTTPLASPVKAAVAPRQRDADRSQAAILQAARDEFAEHGLGGARVERIAERAGLNKRLIYYYFDNKDALFLAVLEHTYRQHPRGRTAAAPDRPAARAALRRLTEFTWNYYLQHPEFLLAAEQRQPAPGAPPAGFGRGRETEHAADPDAGRGAGTRPCATVCSAAGSTRCSCTSRSPRWPTSTWATAHTLSAIFGRNLMSPQGAPASGCRTSAT